ncbi:TRAP transporter small permease [Bradyrhizobium sp. LHD-71]|uniref:TRAP transporter small permease n=1 Tax=Bradyrhizobium sp. LHD-71 TaxID=3072141 RepID=UPI00280E83CA|nr:TRAP transporter small permease [Bradyrhizobium sp. LHD-71]MDQ8727155.1 TRAP transporter small permease [Bradyrhizobium sp. LHD-71]
MLARLVRSLLDGLYLGAGWLAGLFLIVIFLLMMALSAGRKFGLNVPAGDDFAAWSMAAMAFLGLAHTFKSGEMIRVGLLIDRLHGRTRQVVEVVALLMGIIFVGYFAWHALNFTYYSWLTNEVATGVVPLKMWIPQLGYSGGLAILTIAMVDELVHVLAGHRPRYEKEPPKTAEEAVERAAASAV